MAEKFSIESKLNFRELSLLIVDPNEFSRSLTRDICRSFRFGNITVVGNSLDAIDLLATNLFDVVICDWALHPHSGAGFVRHSRTAAKMRNVCVPIIVLTAVSDLETITVARDIGIHDFLTRPLVLGRLASCLSRTLGAPQTFIRCESYVGPNRRRKQRPFDGPERRAGKFGGTSFRPDEILATAGKLSKPGGLTIGEMVAAGEAVILESEQHYRSVRSQDLDHLFTLTRELKETHRPDDDLIKKLYLKSNDLKGMGQTFGYPLLTDAGELSRAVLKFARQALPFDQVTRPWFAVQGRG